MNGDHVDDEAVLSRFRHWLREARDEVDRLDLESFGDGEEPPAVGLCELIEEFTALRQELKLQTKSGRAIQEQSEAILPALRQAIDQFRSVEPREAKAAWSAGKGLAESLADLDEALERGRKEIEKAHRRLVTDAALAFEASLLKVYKKRFFLWRRIFRSFRDETLAVFQQDVQAIRKAQFDALQEGYGLIQARLKRAMIAEQVCRISCEGRAVDPELMNVIEVVETREQPEGHVVEEVRSGYTWQGRILRCAEVRAARAPVE
jgi:molecular chaperone GrpE